MKMQSCELKEFWKGNRNQESSDNCVNNKESRKRSLWDFRALPGRSFLKFEVRMYNSTLLPHLIRFHSASDYFLGTIFVVSLCSPNSIYS